MTNSRHILDDLYDVLLSRKNADGEKSYVASLYRKGTEAICAKVTEEAQETIVEARAGDVEKLKAESADLLFHLMLLWAQCGITPEDVFSVLRGRFGTGGHEEKSRRS